MKTKDFDYEALAAAEEAQAALPTASPAQVWVTEITDKVSHKLKNDTAVIIEPGMFLGEVVVVDTPDHRVYLAAANKLLEVAKSGETFLLYGHAGEIVNILKHRKYEKFEYSYYNGNYLSVTFK